MAYLNFVLHAHLPFVRHPEHERFLEEEWLFEAITETYIPLLCEFETLTKENIPFRLTMSLTPTLCEMMADELLQTRYLNHINRLRELSEKECARTKNDPRFCHLAAMYRNHFEKCYQKFTSLNRNLLAGFRTYQRSGNLELITCGATHGFLPNLRQSQGSVEAQVEVGIRNFQKHFQIDPLGIWLPECGYYPGLDAILKKAGLKYFFTDAHSLNQGKPPPPQGCYAPVETPAGLFCFARDPESSKAVWSAEEGYPGDIRYREFYRDIGFDLDLSYVRPYIHPMGFRTNTGIKYHRITGKDPKEPYVLSQAMEAVEQHAAHFYEQRLLQAATLDAQSDGHAHILCPYDAELFGHWWHEGPMWLGAVLRRASGKSSKLIVATPKDYLQTNPSPCRSEPAFSSWGAEGYADMWLNETNDWIYPHLHRAGDLMREIAGLPESGAWHHRTRNQMARELLLAQSSDWAFIMKTGTMVQYAVKRTKVHLHHFLELYWQQREDRIDETFLNHLEATDNLFPEIDYRIYARS